MDTKEISVLAEDYSNKQAILEGLSMHNVYGLSQEELKKLDIQYHIADSNCIEAWGKLEAAKRRQWRVKEK